jgi:hypothetical protein
VHEHAVVAVDIGDLAFDRGGGAVTGIVGEGATTDGPTVPERTDRVAFLPVAASRSSSFLSDMYERLTWSASGIKATGRDQPHA